MKHGGIGISDPQLSEEFAYNISKATSEVLVGSLLGGTNFNYMEHKAYLRRSSADAWKKWEYSDIEVLTRSNELLDGAGLNRLWQAADNGAWLTDITQRLNVMEFSSEEYQGTLLLR